MCRLFAHTVMSVCVCEWERKLYNQLFDSKNIFQRQFL